MLLFILLLFFICRCFSFCCCIFIWFPGYFAMSPALYPGFSDLRRPPPALSSTPTTFYCFFFFIYRKHYGFEWAFFTHTQAFFTLCSFPTFLAHPNIFGTFLTFWHNLLLPRFYWEPAVTFLKVAGLHTDPQNTDPVHLFIWFRVIHNLLYILHFYLCMSILQKFLLVVKTLIKNIDQQPN